MRSSPGPSQYIASICFQAESVLLWRDKGMPKGWLYNWKGMATMESKTQRHFFGGKLACSLSVHTVKASPGVIMVRRETVQD
jgi:hypothetical protein